MLDLKKEKNFFETRVIDYQTGGASLLGLAGERVNGANQGSHDRPGSAGFQAGIG